MSAGPAGVPDRWAAVFADDSGASFGTTVLPDVVLEGSVLVRALHGRSEVWSALRTAAGIYDRFGFTGHASSNTRHYLEWTGYALGQEMAGVTVLVVDPTGLVERVALHHRPLPAALSFSVEMRRRLVTTLDPTLFYASAGL